MVVCLTSARFNMKADILKANPTSTFEPDEEGGEWVSTQDPDSGEIIRSWQPSTGGGSGQSPEVLKSFKCVARSIVDGGVRVAGTTERWGPLYEGVDYVVIYFGANVNLTRRDRVTNIRGSNGKVIWLEEERDDRAPTIFSVNGVSPIVDPFGKHTENMALLERATDQ